jgi:lipoyl synthase
MDSINTKKKTKPSWLKISLPGGTTYKKVNRIIKECNLSTVCTSAKCPNIGKCWSDGTATFMILGDVCTRGCGFCAVNRGNPEGLIKADEPEMVSTAVKKLGLDYVVITSVTRDDLADSGSGLFAETIFLVKKNSDKILVEVLIPDYSGADLLKIVEAKPSVIAHNVEVVERLTPLLRHSKFNYSKSLKTLKQVKQFCSQMITKSSVMLGLGETDDEVKKTIDDLFKVGVDILVIGQYLRPTKNNEEVKKYVTPEEFEKWSEHSYRVGFKHVVAGPLVRTSYEAALAYSKCL